MAEANASGAEGSLLDGSGPADVDALPTMEDLPEIVLVGHSPLFYWWPVWLTSLIVGAVTALNGAEVAIGDDGVERVAASDTGGLIFLGVLLMVILFTSVRVRGLVSIIILLSAAVVFLLALQFGLLSLFAALIPDVSVHANAGFYLFFGAALLIIWALQTFVFDRAIYYRVRPGQVIEERVLGGGERSFDGKGMLFEQKDRDLFTHVLLGFGAGDLELISDDARKEAIQIRNVLLVERRISQIQRLINVKPDQVLGAG